MILVPPAPTTDTEHEKGLDNRAGRAQIALEGRGTQNAALQVAD
jgi:hypothetical protein